MLFINHQITFSQKRFSHKRFYLLSKFFRFLIFSILILLIVILSYSCDNNSSRYFKSNGEIKTVKYDLEYFDKVKIYSDFEIVFENSPFHSITITTGENLIPFIDYDVENSVLTLRDRNSCDFLRKYIKTKLIISAPKLSQIDIMETCDLISYDTLYFDKLIIDNYAGILKTDLLLFGDSLYFRCHASTGDYRLSGSSKFAYFYNRGSGYLRAIAFIANYIHAVHYSLGDSEVNANETLKIEFIDYGRIISFSDKCPLIITDRNWGDKFENLGCPQ